MDTILYSFAGGFAIGVLFAFAKLPAPAPVTLAGVVAIAGMWLGAQVLQLVLNH